MIFKKYHLLLCNSSFRIVQDKDVAKDVVQEVFIHFWKIRSQTIIINLKLYLQKSAINGSLNYLKRHHKIQFTEIEDAPEIADINASNEMSDVHDLEAAISKTIASLPPACRIVFCLSRFDDLGNAAIAEQLQISVKAVEKQITKALKRLRENLKDFMVR
jgi:RNA polymerase sigma-70 factor, ECF subfamily